MFNGRAAAIGSCRVALVLDPRSREAIALALSRLGFALEVHDTAAEAARAWESTDPLPDCVFFALDDPAVALAARRLRNRAELPACIGVYEPGTMAQAVGVLRQGFYDCVPGPLDPEQAASISIEALAARAELGAAAGGDPISALIELAAEPEPVRAAELAAAAIARRRGPCRLAAAGRIFPGGTRLDASGDAPAPGDATVWTGALAPGVVLLLETAPGTETAPVSPLERLIGALLARVLEIEAIRRQALPPEVRDRLEKLGAFGEAALALNHDVNNPLCAITLNVQLLAMSLGSAGNPKLVERVHAIEENAGKIQRLIHDLASRKPRLEERSAPGNAGKTGSESHDHTLAGIA